MFQSADYERKKNEQPANLGIPLLLIFISQNLSLSPSLSTSVTVAIVSKLGYSISTVSEKRRHPRISVSDGKVCHPLLSTKNIVKWLRNGGSGRRKVESFKRVLCIFHWNNVNFESSSSFVFLPFPWVGGIFRAHGSAWMSRNIPQRIRNENPLRSSDEYALHTFHSFHWADKWEFSSKLRHGRWKTQEWKKAEKKWKAENWKKNVFLLRKSGMNLWINNEFLSPLHFNLPKLSRVNEKSISEMNEVSREF